MIARIVPPGTLAGSAMLFVPMAVVSLAVWTMLGLAWQGTITHYLILTVAVLALSTFTGNSGNPQLRSRRVHGLRGPR